MNQSEWICQGHEDHALAWVVSGQDGACIACITQALDNGSVKCLQRQALDVLIRLLQNRQPDLQSLFQKDRRVPSSVLLLLLGIYKYSSPDKNCMFLIISIRYSLTVWALIHKSYQINLFLLP